ncbi:DUF4232 domain-containing protein [Leifsonia aquatica]|jgi:hypothetical protein|uniref:DUF4232 domain-containing protein n=1 Tax=Leifsonia aquatica TaxID=144185 RepID=A0A7W4UZP1_LEIAQ|nr:DUF4232 domain-containing protein [Leifsonia aquatica]MBB2969190.1 hypothetical protein [Leifsonia aquatica]
MARSRILSSRPAAPRLVAAALAAGALVLAVAGCSASGSPTSTPTASTSTSTSTATSTPRPTGTSSSAPVDGQCDTGSLSGSIQPGGGGAAGSVEVTLVLTNNGSAQCALQGWPGVSFVGDGNGTQLGAPADFDRSAPHPTVTLQPGGTAQAALKIVQAGNYSESECDPKQADGFRVYPPGSTESLFVKDADVTACQSDSISLLTVKALVPGA